MAEGTASDGVIVSALPDAPPRPVSWLRAMRVWHWAHFLLLPAAGWDLALDHAAAALCLARGVVIAFAVLAFGYLLNGIADRHMDRSAEKNPLKAGEPGAAHYGALAALALLAIGLALTAPGTVLAATSICLASGVVYSVGPRLKRYPILGTVLNTTNFTPLLFVGLARDAAPAGMVPLAIAFTCLVVQNQLLHEAADRDEDTRAGIRTSVRTLGTRGAAVVAAAFGAVLASTASATPELAALTWPLAAIHAIAFPLTLGFRGADAAAMARARLAHRVSSIIAGALIFAGLRLVGSP